MKKKRKLFIMICLVLAITIGTISPVVKTKASVKGSADRLIEIATKYKGKKLSAVKTAMKKDGYTLWKSTYKSAWCAWYVSNCAKAAGIKASVIPHTTYASISTFRTGGTYHKGKGWKGTYTPKRGDLIFYTWDKVYSATDHIEIVTSVKDGKVYAIGGNTTSKSIVSTRSMSLSSKYIKGYVTPNYQAASSTSTTYIIKYNANGGSGAPASQTKTKGKTLTLRTTKPTRTGYTFKGWAKSSTATSATYTAGASYTTDASVTLYAVWKANTWTVQYYANGGSGSMANTTHTYGIHTYIRSNSFTRSGYTFGGWYAYRPAIDKWAYKNGSSEGWYVKGKQPSGYTLKVYSNGCWLGATTSVNNDVVKFYAVWKAGTTSHKITFNEISKEISVANDGTFTIPTVNVASGYTLLGTYVKRVKDNTYYVRGKGWVSVATVITNGIAPKLYPAGSTCTLDSSWRKGCENSDYIFYYRTIKNDRSDGSHLITMSANGGTGAFDQNIVMNNSQFTITTVKPTRSGYTFKGWYVKRSDGLYYKAATGWVSSNVEAKIYNSEDLLTFNSIWTNGCAYADYTFYAKWIAN